MTVAVPKRSWATTVAPRRSASARAVADAVDVPVIASGGAGSLDHLVDAVSEGGADAVLCASIFHYGQYTVPEVREALRSAGVPMRP